MPLPDIPILNYHKISNQREFGITTVKIAEFYNQIRYLNKAGFDSVTFKDLLNPHKLPVKPVIITFDDGYQSVYNNALPILTEFGFKAIVFIVTNYIGKINEWEAFKVQRKHRHLSREQIIELNKNGFEIGSHSQSHIYLNRLEVDKIYEELYYSKIKLASLINDEVISICFPYGKFNQKVIEMTEKAGYKFATGNKTIRYSSDKLHYLMRRTVYEIDNIDSYQKKLQITNPYRVDQLIEKIIQFGSGIGIIKKIISTKT